MKIKEEYILLICTKNLIKEGRNKEIKRKEREKRFGCCRKKLRNLKKKKRNKNTNKRASERARKKDKWIDKEEWFEREDGGSFKR